MKKTKQELAQDYSDLKQKQALGEFASIDLAIMKHTFMAGYDAANQHTALLIEFLQKIDGYLSHHLNGGINTNDMFHSKIKQILNNHERTI